METARDLGSRPAGVPRFESWPPQSQLVVCLTCPRRAGRPSRGRGRPAAPRGLTRPSDPRSQSLGGTCPPPPGLGRPASIPCPARSRRRPRGQRGQLRSSWYPGGDPPPEARPVPDAPLPRTARSPSRRTARTSSANPGPESREGLRTRDDLDRRPIARRGDTSPPHARIPISPQFAQRLPDSPRRPSRRRCQTSWEISQRRLAFDLADVHGRADLFFDFHRQGRANRRDAGQVARIRLLKVLQRLEAPLEQRASAHPADAAEGDQLEEFFLDPVLHLDREPRQRADLLLVEDPAEFAHRVQEPLGLVCHAADVSGPYAELLRDLLLRPLRDPVVEERRGLDLREEEVVVFDREREVGFLDFLLDPCVVAAAQVELGHVGRRAHGPQVEEAVVAGLVQCVAHLDRAEWVDVEIARPLAEERGPEEAVVTIDEILLRQEVENVEDFATDRVDVACKREEGTVEERKEFLLRADVARRDVGKDVHAQGGLGPELGLDCFGFAEEVVLHQLVDVVLVFREENCFAVWIVTWPTGPSAHLFDLHHWYRREPQVHIEPVEISDDDPSRGGIDTHR